MIELRIMRLVNGKYRRLIEITDTPLRVIEWAALYAPSSGSGIKWFIRGV